MKIKTLKTNDAIRRECSSREFNIFYFYIFYSKFFRRETQTNDRTNARRRRATRASRVATPSIDFDPTPLRARRVYACLPVVPVAFVLSLPVVPVDKPALAG